MNESKTLNWVVALFMAIAFIAFTCLAAAAYFNIIGIPHGTGKIDTYPYVPKSEVAQKFEGDFEYKIIRTKTEDGDTLSKVKIIAYSGTDKEIEIPRTIENKEVFSIGNSCFYQNSDIESIKIPGTVTTVESFAFYECPNLKNVIFVFNNNDLDIKDHAFYGCSQITNLKFLNLHLNIGHLAFMNCTSLSEISFKKDCLLRIGVRAFRNTAFETVELPQRTEYIGNAAFSNCKSLKKLDIPKYDKMEIGQNITKIDGYSNSITPLQQEKNCFQMNTVKNMTTIQTKNIQKITISVFLLQEGRDL